MTKKRLTATDADNILTDHFLTDRFMLLALNKFQWEGLPPTIQERHIERVQYNEGRVLFFEDPLNGKLCLPCMGVGANVYGDPTSWQVNGFNYSKHIALSDGVLIENNKLWVPTKKIVNYFVNQLFEVIRTRDINIKTLKRPFFIKTDPQNELTVKNIMSRVDDNEWAVFGDKQMGLENAVEVFQTGVQCLTAELTDTYHDILNEALTYLGINNANTDKRERLITSEADANNQLIDSCADIFLESRQRACEAINERFGLNVSVKVRTEREEKEEKADESQMD